MELHFEETPMTKVQIAWLPFLMWVMTIFLMFMAFQNMVFTPTLILSGVLGLICGTVFTTIEHRKIHGKEYEIHLLVTDTIIVIGVIAIPSIFLHLEESMSKLLLIFLSLFSLSPAIKATLIAFSHRRREDTDLV
jgi:hypothetical protein